MAIRDLDHLDGIKRVPTEKRKCNESITELILNPYDVIQILMHPEYYDSTKHQEA